MSSVVDLNNTERMDLVVSRSNVNHLQTFPGFAHRRCSLRQAYSTSKVDPFEVLKPLGFVSLDSTTPCCKHSHRRSNRRLPMIVFYHPSMEKLGKRDSCTHPVSGLFVQTIEYRNRCDELSNENNKINNLFFGRLHWISIRVIRSKSLSNNQQRSR